MPDYFWTHVWLAMNYGQLGRKQEAKVALATLLELSPDITHNFLREWRKYNLSEDEIAHAVDGLRKAGLEIPPETK